MSAGVTKTVETIPSTFIQAKTFYGHMLPLTKFMFTAFGLRE